MSEKRKYTVHETDSLEKKLNYKFADKKLLRNALCHSSYSNERKSENISSNERMEFLGDSVLSLVVSNYIFENYPNLPEGDLTKTRAAIVCERSLCACAQNIEMGNYLILGHGEEQTGGRTRASILADAFEALIAAIYLDSNFSVVREWLLGQLYDTIVSAVNGKTFTDFKTALQERVQVHGAVDIRYEVVGESGPDHRKTFTVHVFINNELMGMGEGSSKKNAEQMAASDALAKLGDGVA